MLIKSAVAATLAAALAGAVVYYGTPGKSGVQGEMRLQNIEAPANARSQSAEPSQPGLISGLFGGGTAKLGPGMKSASAAGGSDVKYFKYENGTMLEIDALPTTTVILGDADRPNAFAKIVTVMEQAEKINDSDLRDRAYLDVVGFALEEKLYSQAIKAVPLIKQTELRDTARSNIAVIFAKDGDSHTAFRLIEEVEIDELRDVMRLQVIEAMILPEQNAVTETR